MASNNRRLYTAQAAQACMTCKTRKKKCSKSLPSCGYCTKKELDCVYATVAYPRFHASPIVERSTAAPVQCVRGRAPTSIASRKILTAKLPSEQTTSEFDQNQVCLEVHRIIRSTGQFVDDISARYFRSFHGHLPIISRPIFYNKLITMGKSPAADFSALILSLCLITHAPALGFSPVNEPDRSITQHAVYLTAKSIFAQVQVSCPPSVSLIQAGLLLAVYEYMHGRPDDAFVTIAGTGRLAYAVRSNTSDQHRKRMGGETSHHPDVELLHQQQQDEEAANTWWGLIACERTFVSDVTVLDQPLITVFPGNDARLPIEPDVLDQLDILDPGALPNIPISCLTSPRVGGFGRTAQATCFMDQVLIAIGTRDIDSKLVQLERLDTELQAFLSLVMPQCQGQPAVFCSAINIAIRTLFTLHWHILWQDPQAVIISFQSMEEWHRKSQVALDSVTKMVIDIAESLIGQSAACDIDAMPPMYPYITRAALKHLHHRVQSEDVAWVLSGKDALQISLDKYLQRWSVSDDWARPVMKTNKECASRPI